ncbi:MAG TPA: hypothetical protein VMQ17_06190 [Candidatus Sulfotelmatobacter sp.]|nr:hypothetical protein [Candidatus Sulfotelmatobacter sp.]
MQILRGGGVHGGRYRPGIQKQRPDRPRVDVLEPDQKVKKYLVDHPRSVPIVLTRDTNLAAMYNAQVYPIYVVIDRDGNIAGEQRGAGERGLREILRRAVLESQE